MEQYDEVSNLKTFFTSNKLNVSAGIIEKAIVFPEDAERAEPVRNYPKVNELLFHNPFAKPKKKKKGKKKKRS